MNDVSIERFTAGNQPAYEKAVIKLKRLVRLLQQSLDLNSLKEEVLRHIGRFRH